MRDKCPYKLHWQLDISLHIAAHALRLGLTPIVVAGVRSPFAYYASHYLFALLEQRHGGKQTGGLPWLIGPEHDICWDNLSSARCRAFFQSHVQGRLNASRGSESVLQSFLGTVQQRTLLVPRWAWVRVELLSTYLPRVYENIKTPETAAHVRDGDLLHAH